MNTEGKHLTSTPARDAVAQKRAQQRRSSAHDEPWSRATVVLFDRQIVYLDRLCADIRATTSSAVSRAEVIRALIDALADSELDVTDLGSEAELKARLVENMRQH